jgi:hypothetical protein
MLVDYIVNYVRIYIQNFLKVINVIFEKKNHGCRGAKNLHSIKHHTIYNGITCAGNIILFRLAVKRILDFLATN